MQHVRALRMRRALLVGLAVLLLLKAAVPLIATFVARQQGVELAEVCSVYGVRLLSTGNTLPNSPDGQVGQHADGHCLLGALLNAAFAPPQVPTTSLSSRSSESLELGTEVTAPPRWDAQLAWFVARTHAPPVLA